MKITKLGSLTLRLIVVILLSMQFARFIIQRAPWWAVCIWGALVVISSMIIIIDAKENYHGKFRK